MTRKPDFNRLREALDCGIPAEVPIVDIFISGEVKAGLLGRPIQTPADEISFWVENGFDYVKASARGYSYNPSRNYPEEGDRGWAQEGTGQITSMEDFESYPFPTLGQLDFSHWDDLRAAMPEEMAFMGGIPDIWELVWQLMGFEAFSFAVYQNPELVEKLFEQCGSFCLGVTERVAEQPRVGVISGGDDLAYKTGCMVDPEIYRKHLFPWYRRIVETASAHGLPFIYHSDGDLRQVLDDFVDIGISALHPIEPAAMDIYWVKENYGDKLCLIGGVDIGELLTRGTLEMVRAEVKTRCERLGPLGGYCVGSSNSLPPYVKVENVRAMIEAAIEYGRVR